MSVASDLIERIEKETGQRVDCDNGDNLATAGLFGAMNRIMGQASSMYTQKQDVAAGVLIKNQMTSEYEQKKESERVMVSMLSAGISPDDVKSLFG